ncbi:MAG TPA: ABC transporter permease, partial [Longimicrobiaceae bacterium]|nr:ABC transporter permease [Longimicrobiaceae bacterium]
MNGLFARARSFWRGLRRPGQLAAEMDEEMRFHLEMEAERLAREKGLAPEEALRPAAVAFGGVEKHKEEGRDARGLTRVHGMSLDFRLGVRMARRHPGLSLVSVTGMSVAIAIGAGGFGFVGALMDATLPLDEGERVVALQSSDARNPGSPRRQSLHDFLLWREELVSVRDLAAFAGDGRNLTIPGGGTAAVEVARMTASGFRVARVAPVLGRPLLDDDERAGAQPVVVIAHEEWRRRFGGDPAVVGRPVRLDTTVHTVVGVMPEGFRFPVNHRYWVPLRLDPAEHAPGAGPEILVFGRLAGGATLERARAELATIGLRRAAADPETHGHLRPLVVPYTHAFIGIDSPARAWLLRAAQFALGLLLVVVSVNVAILVYARTAMRTGEIVVRTALGASRRRVVAQLFAEALVLSLAAATIGLAVAGLGLEAIQDFLRQGNADGLPFWVELGLSPALVAYVTGLAVVAALIMGVVPALKATGRSVQTGLQQLSSGGSRMQLGRTWTALVVAQIAVAVAALPYSLFVAGQSVRRGAAEAAYPAEEILRASLSMEREGAPAGRDPAAHEEAVAARFRGSAAELLRRLRAEPAVSGVALASRFPGSEEVGQVEVEGAGTRSWVWTNQVDAGLFAVFDVPVVAGRGLVEADAARGANAVVVDRVFAERVLGGGDVLGRRVRALAPAADGEPGKVEAGPWLEIVGVVPEFTVPPAFEERAAPKLYRPLALADAPGAVQLAVRVRRGAGPAAFAGRLREVTGAVDPALRLDELRTASDAERERRRLLLYTALGVVAVTGSVLLLSAAGIYAMTSFVVARRRREIGIRAALGALPHRLLAG